MNTLLRSPLVTSSRPSCLKMAVIGGAILAAVITSIVALVFWLTSAPTEAARTFVQQIGSGQVEEAYQSTASQFKEAATQEVLAAFIAENPVFTSIADISFTSRNIEGGIATISGTITSAAGMVAPVMVQLIKEQGEWRVLNIELTPPEV